MNGKTESNTGQQQLMFAEGNTINYATEDNWYQNNLDVVFPLLIIIVGLFQFVLRKWIFPVSEDVVSKLENQLPTQGLIYMPEFGAVIAVLGVVLLVLLNFILPAMGS